MQTLFRPQVRLRTFVILVAIFALFFAYETTTGPWRQFQHTADAYARRAEESAKRAELEKLEGANWATLARDLPNGDLALAATNERALHHKRIGRVLFGAGRQRLFDGARIQPGRLAPVGRLTAGPPGSGSAPSSHPQGSPRGPASALISQLPARLSVLHPPPTERPEALPAVGRSWKLCRGQMRFRAPSGARCSEADAQAQLHPKSKFLSDARVRPAASPAPPAGPPGRRVWCETTIPDRTTGSIMTRRASGMTSAK